MSVLLNGRRDRRSDGVLAHRLARFLEAGRRYRLRQSVVLLCALAPIAFAGYFAYQSAQRQMTDAVLAKRDDIAYLVASLLKEKLDRLIDVGVSLATRVRFHQLVERQRWNDAIAIMTAVPATHPYIERLFLADRRGVLVADTPALGGVRGRDFSFRDWYRGVVQTGEPYVSHVYRRTAAPRINVVAVAVPVKNESQELIAILVLQVKLEAFFEWFKNAPRNHDAAVYVVDRDGRAALHPRATAEGETIDVSSSTAVQKALRGLRGVEITRDSADGERISAYAPVLPFQWGVVVSERGDTAFAARDAQLRRFAIVYALILVLSAVAALLFLRARGQARRKADLEALVAERTRELEASNKELEAFSYSVSHDLRAPLRSIDGFSRVLLDDCEDKLAPDDKSHLQRIRAATQRMGALIDDLLVLSRVTRAGMTRRRIDLSALADSIVGELRGAYPQRSVTVHIEPGVTALGDAALLRVVLENLLGNAWKFTAKTENARIEFGAAPAVGRPAYFVRDNGAGFDMKYADKLFGVFQRLHGMEEFPGTGVGLASVQRIVARHGGRIWAEGAVGEGATFHFTLQPEESST